VTRRVGSNGSGVVDLILDGWLNLSEHAG